LLVVPTVIAVLSLHNHSLAIDIVHVCSSLDDPARICVSWFSSKFF